MEHHDPWRQGFGQTEPPLVGVALSLKTLRIHREMVAGTERPVEIWGVAEADGPSTGWTAPLTAARDLLTEHRGPLGLHGPNLPISGGGSISGLDPGLRAHCLPRFRRWLAFAGELGASQLVVHSNFVPFGWDGRRIGRFAAQAADLLGELVPDAERAGCSIVVENSADPEPAPVAALVARLESPWVRASLDTGHAATQGPPVDRWVSDLGEVLAHVHLHDTDGYADRHWAIGRGVVSWAAFFGAIAELADHGQRPRLLVETMPGGDDVPASIAWLRSHGFAR